MKKSRARSPLPAACFAMIALVARVESAHAEAEAPATPSVPATPVPLATPSANAPSPCVAALPHVAASARVSIESSCGSTGRRVHDGDVISFAARGHVRLEARVDDDRELEVMCMVLEPLALTVGGRDAPWLAPPEGVACADWSKNERICKKGDADVVVCDAVARKVQRREQASASSLGLPTWYVGDVVETVETAETAETVEVADGANASTRSTATPTAAPRVLSIAVYNLTLAGVEPRVGNIVTTSLLTEVRKLVGVSVIGLDDVKAMLEHEANKQAVGCSEESCLGDVADALGVDAILVGSLVDVDGQRVIELKRIDQNQATVTNTFTKRLEAEGGEEFLAAIGPGVEQLFPDRALLPGRTRGVDPEVALRLNPPPLQRWTFFTAAGGATALFVGGAVASAVAVASSSQAESELARSTAEVVEGSAVMGPHRTAVTSTIVADTLFISGVVAAAGAGVVALFVDWKGYGNEL